MVIQSNFSKFLVFILFFKFLLYPSTFYYSMVLDQENFNIIKSFLDNFIISMMLASITYIFWVKLINIKK